MEIFALIFGLFGLSVLMSMLRHGLTDKRERQLGRELHAQIPADDRTLLRWREWWQHILPATMVRWTCVCRSEDRSLWCEEVSVP